MCFIDRSLHASHHGHPYGATPVAGRGAWQACSLRVAGSGGPRNTRARLVHEGVEREDGGDDGDDEEDESPLEHDDSFRCWLNVAAPRFDIGRCNRGAMMVV